VSDGIWPEVCPVCSAPKDQFLEFKWKKGKRVKGQKRG
jgi:hypothetical protein